jgi:hypothetical protein
MYRRSNALLSVLLVLLLAKQLAAQQEVCLNLFAQGYYDEQQTFSDQRSFKYVQATICSDTTLTKQQADDRSLGSGGSYFAVITGFLDVGDKQKSFEEQRTIFCSMNLDTSTANASLIQTSRVVSQAATAVMKSCFNSQGFHAAIVPSKNPASFAIRMTYNGTGVTDIPNVKISGNPNITCDTPNGTTVHSGANIICTKDADKTVLVTMNTDKGSLNAIDVLGTKDINDDIQSQLKTLTDKVTAVGLSSCLGCIQQSVLTEAQFQNVNGSNWVLCDGRTIVGSKLARLTGISNAPDLRGRFLRGKNFGTLPDVDEIDLGKPQEDAVGPHHHSDLVHSPPFNDQRAGISYQGPSTLATDDPMFPNSSQAKETRPKNVTVNFFYKIN